jgi:hypothetical protein
MQKNEHKETILIGDTELKQREKEITGEYVLLLEERFYKIQNYDAMEPFFMSLVSSSDHWLFISSTGGLTAGRVSPDQSLFPYYTEDKLSTNSGNTGSKAILLVSRGKKTSLWELFSDRQAGNYRIQRNIYKNVPGTAVIFEEVNQDLGLTYRHAWRTGEKFGFVKTTWLINPGNSSCRVDLVDGIQNILPAGVTVLTQNTFSCLLDAYKRSELDIETGLAIFTLNSNLTDLAEPSESLVATSAAQLGLEQVDILLSSDQLDGFRQGKGVTTETEIRGKPGAYFVHSVIDLGPGAERAWHLFADVNQDSAAIVKKIEELRGDKAVLFQEVEEDIKSNTSNLCRLVSEADGLQLTNAMLVNANHFANVMFNIMRGGIFADQGRISKRDFLEFITGRNRAVSRENAAFLAGLPDRFSISDLQDRAEANSSPDLVRLSYSYLPLTFSRRHGDPSRPWNQFETWIKNKDGTLRLDYQGNWRDIFQNWEALAYSHPEYVESMICTFLNATTVDGYNPYRITYQGINWEIPEPNNPWANFGYWSDHQVIYLQKLMEISDRVHPGRLQKFLVQPMFSYAHVPYQIKPYADLLKDPFSTITFNWDLQRSIEKRVLENGSDGKLVHTPNGQVLQVSLGEKLLTLLLAKLANFVPEGGIWMNTQRPEWNDANNALVGKGLSMVTLCHMRRQVFFLIEILRDCNIEALSINTGVQAFYARVFETLVKFMPFLKGSFTDEARRRMMDALGEAGSDYRWDFYMNGYAGRSTSLSVKEMIKFLDLVQQYIDHSLLANKRSDNLYHSYNIIHIHDSSTSISDLYEMLEGQVAILSSGLLSSEESLTLLESLRNSSLYQSDQNTYILYPDRKVPGFLEKNCIPPEQMKELKLFSTLVEAGDSSLIVKDIHGIYRFCGSIRNARDVSRALEALRKDSKYSQLVVAESKKIQDIFEATFHHDEFTGRSGTFFAYEGLGSVYWHMVAKLLLAVQETILRTKNGKCTSALVEKYKDIRDGLSFTKSAAVYGAFPTDPYSHTPKGRGAKQPGMTGSVKEQILARQAELGMFIENGRFVFDPFMLDLQELLTAPAIFHYQNVHGQQQSLELEAGSLVYCICQTPVVLKKSNKKSIQVYFSDGASLNFEGNVLDPVNSRHISQRDGTVKHLRVYFPPVEKPA